MTSCRKCRCLRNPQKKELDSRVGCLAFLIPRSSKGDVCSRGVVGCNDPWWLSQIILYLPPWVVWNLFIDSNTKKTTVGGSEIPRPTTVWMFSSLVKSGINYQPQLVQDFFHQPDIRTSVCQVDSSWNMKDLVFTQQGSILANISTRLHRFRVWNTDVSFKYATIFSSIFNLDGWRGQDLSIVDQGVFWISWSLGSPFSFPHILWLSKNLPRWLSDFSSKTRTATFFSDQDALWRSLKAAIAVLNLAEAAMVVDPWR